MTAFTRSRSAKILAGVALLSASAIVVAGCSSTPSEEPSDGGGGGSTADLTLELGSLLPQTGSLSFLGRNPASASPSRRSTTLLQVSRST